MAWLDEDVFGVNIARRSGAERPLHDAADVDDDSPGVILQVADFKLPPAATVLARGTYPSSVLIDTCDADAGGKPCDRDNEQLTLHWCSHPLGYK